MKIAIRIVSALYGSLLIFLGVFSIFDTRERLSAIQSSGEHVTPIDLSLSGITILMSYALIIAGIVSLLFILFSFIRMHKAVAVVLGVLGCLLWAYPSAIMFLIYHCKKPAPITEDEDPPFYRRG